MEINMRIVFIGCVKTSGIFLRKLLSLNAEIVGIVTKRESAFNADFEDLGKMAESENICLHYTKNINDDEACHFIQNCSPDIIFCFGWSQLLSQKILDIPPMGAVGFHPAQLPYNRGRHPLIWSLVLGLPSTASTFFELGTGADTGRILSQEVVEIEYEDDAQRLYDKITLIACQQIEKFMEQFSKGKVIYIPQKKEDGNSWRKRGQNDGKIDWRMSSYSIYNLVRALTHPYVGAHFVLDGREYKVWKVREVDEIGSINLEPGKVLSVFSKTQFIVKTGEKAIEVLDCEPIELNKGDYIME